MRSARAPAEIVPNGVARGTYVAMKRPAFDVAVARAWNDVMPIDCSTRSSSWIATPGIIPGIPGPSVPASIGIPASWRRRVTSVYDESRSPTLPVCVW